MLDVAEYRCLGGSSYDPHSCPAPGTIGPFLRTASVRAFHGRILCRTYIMTSMRISYTAAHVDHGKTTLMDQLLRACGVETGTERFMDSNALEKERGITISSKYTSMQWRGHVLNAVDTPGHADFGGEVER